jgi:DNA-directed RNA polymerase subunit RPC12/RpoP
MKSKLPYICGRCKEVFYLDKFEELDCPNCDGKLHKCKIF